MRNHLTRFIPFAFIASILLTACGGRGTLPPPTVQATPIPPTATSEPAPVAPPETPTPTVIIPIPTPLTSIPFDGNKAMGFVNDQMHFGPRPTGSEENRSTAAYI